MMWLLLNDWTSVHLFFLSYMHQFVLFFIGTGLGKGKSFLKKPKPETNEVPKPEVSRNLSRMLYKGIMSALSGRPHILNQTTVDFLTELSRILLSLYYHYNILKLYSLWFFDTVAIGTNNILERLAVMTILVNEGLLLVKVNFCVILAAIASLRRW